MGNAHWWLIALAFVLGLALTFALMVRRVEREVPVSTSTAATSAGATTSATATGAAAAESKAGKSGSESSTTTAAATDAPYGAGSARAGADGSGPSGWPVKGDEDSMLYHTPDSPSYDQTTAEVWFQDEESAAQAGFTPWRQGEGEK